MEIKCKKCDKVLDPAFGIYEIINEKQIPLVVYTCDSCHFTITIKEKN